MGQGGSHSLRNLDRLRACDLQKGRAQRWVVCILQTALLGCGRRCGVLRHEREQSLLVALGQFFFLRNHADFCRTIALQRN